jgi:hypothetical protein
MEASVMMFLECPAYMDAHGITRSALPAEIKIGTWPSQPTGRWKAARIRCPRGHRFDGLSNSIPGVDVVIIPGSHIGPQHSKRAHGSKPSSHRSSA